MNKKNILSILDAIKTVQSIKSNNIVDELDDEDIDDLIAEEYEAIADYEAALKVTENASARERLTHILEEEKEHVRELEELKAKQEPITDGVSPMTYKKLKELGYSHKDWEKWSDEEKVKKSQTAEEGSKEGSKKPEEKSQLSKEELIKIAKEKRPWQKDFPDEEVYAAISRSDVEKWNKELKEKSSAKSEGSSGEEGSGSSGEGSGKSKEEQKEDRHFNALMKQINNHDFSKSDLTVYKYYSNYRNDDIERINKYLKNKGFEAKQLSNKLIIEPTDLDTKQSRLENATKYTYEHASKKVREITDYCKKVAKQSGLLCTLVHSYYDDDNEYRIEMKHPNSDLTITGKFTENYANNPDSLAFTDVFVYGNKDDRGFMDYPEGRHNAQSLANLLHNYSN